MQRRLLWTPDEDATLRKCVRENNGGLLSEAFRQCSAETGRGVTACATRWYYLRKKNGTRKEGVEFMGVGQSKAHPNTKNVLPNCAVPTVSTVGYWRRLWNALLGKD